MALFGPIFALKAIVEIATAPAKAALAGLETAGRSLGDGLERSFAQGTSSLLKFAAQSAAIAAVTKAFTGAVGVAVEYEAGLRNLNTILGLSDKGLVEYGDRIRDLSKELGLNITATQAIAAAYDVAQTGFTTASENALVLEASLKAAAAANVDASIATEQISSTLKAYRLSAADAGKVSDIYFKTIERGNVLFPEFQQGLGQTNAIAAQAGVQFEQVAAAMATLTNQGFKASTAADGIKGAIDKLIAPQGQAAEAMAKYGIEIDATTLKIRPFNEILQEIYTKVGGNAAALREIFPEMAGFSAVLALTANSGNEFAENVGFMNNALGANDKALKETSKSAKFAFGQMKAALENIGITLGGTLTGPIAKGLSFITAAINKLDDLIRNFDKKEFLEGFRQTFPATATMLDKLWNTFTELKNVVIDFFTEFDTGLDAVSVLDFVFSGIVKIADIIGNATGLLITFINWLTEGFGDAATVIGAISGSIGTAWSQVVDGMTGIWEVFVDQIKGMWMGVVDLMLSTLQSMPGQVRGAFSEMETSLVKERAGLATRKRPGPLALDQSVDKIVGAPGLIPDSVSRALMNKDRAQQEKKDSLEKGSFLDTVAGFLGIGEKKKPTKKEIDAEAARVNANQAQVAAEAAAAKKAAELTEIQKSVDLLDQQVELEKVSKAEGIKRYEALLARAKKAGVQGEELFKIEKGLFDLRKKSATEAEKAAEATAKARVERIKAVQGETAGALAELEEERRERKKAGANSVELEAWYGAKRQEIFKEDAERKQDLVERQQKLEDEASKSAQETLAAQEKPLQAALIGLELQQAEHLRALKEQRDEIIRDHGDRKKAEDAYQAAVLAAQKQFNAQRLKLEKDFLKQKAQETQKVQSDTLRNEAEVEQDPKKRQKMQDKADNADRLQAIKDRVAELRKAEVDELTILRFIASEKKKILQQEKADEQAAQQEGSKAPTITMEEAFSSGFSLGGFSLSTGGRKKKGQVSEEDKELASQVGALAYPGAGTESGKTPAQERADKLRQQGYDVKGPLTPEEEQAMRGQINSQSNFLAASEFALSSLGVDTVDGKNFDPAAAKAGGKMTKTIKGMNESVDSSKPSMDITLTINFQENGKATDTKKASSESGSQLSYNYTPGRIT